MTTAAESLSRSRALVEPALRAAVERLDPKMRLVASYHFGWVDAEGQPTTANAGKALRPGLAVTVAEAVAGSAEAAVPGAVAVELIHNFSLVHDDLIDRDTERRHRPTVWAVWDDTTAILAGDAMSALAHEVLASSGSPRALTASQALGAATRELIRGQAQDVAFEQRDDVTLDECLSMVAGKTGALLAVSAEIGAILTGADDDVCEAFRVFGAELGMAFQIVDDLLGVWGATEVTGKPVYADLAAGKKNLPVVWSLENGGDAGAQLAAWFAEHEVRGDVPLDDLEKAAGLIEEAGGRRWATEAAEQHVAAAVAAIEAVDLTPAARARLVDLARFVTDREQ